MLNKQNILVVMGFFIITDDNETLLPFNFSQMCAVLTFATLSNASSQTMMLGQCDTAAECNEEYFQMCFEMWVKSALEEGKTANTYQSSSIMGGQGARADKTHSQISFQ